MSACQSDCTKKLKGLSESILRNKQVAWFSAISYAVFNAAISYFASKDTSGHQHDDKHMHGIFQLIYKSTSSTGLQDLLEYTGMYVEKDSRTATAINVLALSSAFIVYMLSRGTGNFDKAFKSKKEKAYTTAKALTLAATKVEPAEEETSCLQSECCQDTKKAIMIALYTINLSSMFFAGTAAYGGLQSGLSAAFDTNATWAEALFAIFSTAAWFFSMLNFFTFQIKSSWSDIKNGFNREHPAFILGNPFIFIFNFAAAFGYGARGYFSQNVFYNAWPIALAFSTDNERSNWSLPTTPSAIVTALFTRGGFNTKFWNNQIGWFPEEKRPYSGHNRFMPTTNLTGPEKGMVILAYVMSAIYIYTMFRNNIEMASQTIIALIRLKNPDFNVQPGGDNVTWLASLALFIGIAKTYFDSFIYNAVRTVTGLIHYYDRHHDLEQNEEATIREFMGNQKVKTYAASQQDEEKGGDDKLQLISNQKKVCSAITSGNYTDVKASLFNLSSGEIKEMEKGITAAAG